MDPLKAAAVGITGVTAADNIISGGYRQREAARQQQRYNEQNMATQQRYNKENMAAQQKYNAAEAQKSRDWNTEAEQMKRMSAAGLNPYALFGGKGGGGGGSTAAATSGVAGAGLPSVGIGDSAGVMSNKTAAAQSLAGAAKLNSEIDLNKAAAEKARADADAARANAGIKTGDENVDKPAMARLAAMRGEGELKAIEAFLKKYGMNSSPEGEDGEFAAERDPDTGVTVGMFRGSYVSKQMSLELGEVASAIGKNNAAAELDTERKRYYWQEMLNAIAHADAAKMNAAAKQLEAEYKYGETMTAKWWIENGGRALNAIGSLVP